MESFEAGFFLIDKDLKWTSFDVVNKIRYSLKFKTGKKKMKVGHAGTLDPLASGLLIVCYGKMTKEIFKFQGMDKEYTGTFTLGATTPSYDLETEVNAEFPTEHISQELIDEISKEMTGRQIQLAPIYSAKRIDGKKAYDLARKGEEVKIKEHEVVINEFGAELKENNVVEFKVKCSKGTYIRSLAYDFGKKLNSGAYLSSLRRTAIGDYRVEDALSVREVENLIGVKTK